MSQNSAHRSDVTAMATVMSRTCFMQMCFQAVSHPVPGREPRLVSAQVLSAVQNKPYFHFL